MTFSPSGGALVLEASGASAAGTEPFAFARQDLRRRHLSRFGETAGCLDMHYGVVQSRKNGLVPSVLALTEVRTAPASSDGARQAGSEGDIWDGDWTFTGSERKEDPRGLGEDVVGQKIFRRTGYVLGAD